MMGILVPETCWDNKTTYFLASGWFVTFTMSKMHGHINSKLKMLKGKETIRCDKICSFIASICFGHQTCPSSGVQLVTSAFSWSYLERYAKQLAVVLWCGVLASREFVCDVTACGSGSLVVWYGHVKAKVTNCTPNDGGTRWRSGWGTALQTERSRVRFPIFSLT
jgi:hypothetical protein